jgi:TfoX N-terminal domain
MAYDEQFAARIRKAFGRRTGLVAKQMFGGIAFLLNGNMCVGIHKDELIVRLDPAETEAALAKPHTRVFDLTGRPMKGWILVAPKGIATDAQLAKWIAIAATYAGALPPKK